jgi:beta-lactamase regulating signal transducer with metallopeptidase domain
MMPYAPQSSLSFFNLFTAINYEAARLEIRPHVLSPQMEPASVTHQDTADVTGDEKLSKPDSVAMPVKEIKKGWSQPLHGQTAQELSKQSQENTSTIEEPIKYKRTSLGTAIDWMLSLPIHQAIYYVWLAGVILLGFYMLAVNIRFWMYIKEEKTPIDGEIIHILDECKKLLSIRQRVEIRYTDFAKVPALFGFIAPKILIPASMKHFMPDSEMKYIFLHELAHLKRKDVVVNWLTNILQIIHWFNPIIWVAFSKMREDREIACDAMALYYLSEDETKRYGEAIISVLGNYAAPVKLSGVTGILEKKSQVKRRIKMIAGFNKKRHRWSLATVLVFLLMGCSMLTDPNVENVKNRDNQISNEIDMEATVLSDTVSEDKLENWFIKAGYITRQGEWVYFYGLPLDRENGTYSLTSGPIYRIKLDGTDKTKIVDGDVEYVGIHENWLYYKEGSKLYRINTESREKALLAQDAYGSVAIDDEWIFIAGPNGIIKMRYDGQEREQLVDGRVRDIIAHDGWVYYTTDDGLSRISFDGTQRSVLSKKTIGGIQIWEDKLYYSVVFEKTEAFHPETFYKKVLIWLDDTPYIILDADIYRMNLDGTEKERIADGNLGEVIDGWLVSYLYEDEIGWVIVNIKQIDGDAEYRHWTKFLQGVRVGGADYNNIETFYREIKIDSEWIYQCDEDGLIVIAVSDESKTFRIRQTETGIFYEYYKKPKF